MNLMNAVNALSGVSVGEMTLDPDFRAVGAAALTEGKAVLTLVERFDIEPFSDFSAK